MKTVEVVPFERIGDLVLGIDQSSLRNAVGGDFENQPAHVSGGISFPEKDWFYDHSVSVHYDLQSKLANRVSVGIDSPFKVLFKGLDIFSSEVTQVLSHTHKYGVLSENDTELGYSYIFPKLGIDYWRDSITEDLMADLANADEEDEDCILEDIEKSKKFQLVSIFDEAYWTENND